MTFLITALAALCAGMAGVLNKKLALKGHRASTYTVVIMLTGTALSFPFLLYEPRVSTSVVTWLMVAVSVTAYALSFAFIIKSYRETDVSVVSIIQRLNIVVVALIGVFFLKENYTALSYVGLIFILLSGITIVYEKKKLHLSPGILYAVTGALFSSVASVLDKVVLSDFSPFSYLFINNLLVGLVFAFKSHIIHDAPKLIKQNFPVVLLTSVFMTAAFLLILVVLKTSAVSWVFPIYKGLSLMIPVSMGIVLLGEKQKLAQKITGVTLGIIGIMLLYRG